MENDEKIKRIETFVTDVVIGELDKIQRAELAYMQFVIMGQAIEVLGGFLDQKPMKAKEQSAKRFAMGIKYLMGGKYRVLNENYYLYDVLRNQMTHTFIPGNDLILLNKGNNPDNLSHLEKYNKKLVLVSEVFYQDICCAGHRLIDLLKSGQVKPKNIAFGDDE